MGGKDSKEKKAEEDKKKADEEKKKADEKAKKDQADKEAKAKKDEKDKKESGGGTGEGGEEEVASGGKENDFKAGTDGAAGEESYSFWDRNKTFKPEKKIKGQKKEKLHNTIKATMKATLGGGDLRKTVQLPDGEDLQEWIAVNTVHFYNAANMIYGTCAEFCTNETCKQMSAGRNEYLWKDEKNYKKPTKVSAPEYIDLLLNWVNEQISDPALFPIDENAKFPKNFMPKVKDIYKRLFRLYAHIYYSHFDKIDKIGAKAHLNTCFKHFVFFILEFKLVDDKDLAPLKNFIDKFKDEAK